MKIVIAALSAPEHLNGVSRHAANVVRGLLTRVGDLGGSSARRVRGSSKPTQRRLRGRIQGFMSIRSQFEGKQSFAISGTTRSCRELPNN